MRRKSNDYPIGLAGHVVRSLLFRTGQYERLGRKFWRPTIEAPYIHQVYSRHVEMFDGIPTDFADPTYNAMIGPESINCSAIEETITAIDNAWVEPSRCQVIGPDGRLVRRSLTHRVVPVYPSAFRYAMHGKGVALPEAVVYDGYHGTNFYHHLVDMLPIIELLFERSGLPRDIPLIVNRWLFESRFFAYLYQRSPAFAALNWRIQEPGEWLRVDRLYRLDPPPYVHASLVRSRALYSHLSEPKGRRVFLSRDSKRYGRGIRNEAEVAALLGSHGFETVYAEHLTLEQQQALFEETTHLVALQGMGMAQMIFMDWPQGHILELTPRDRITSEYYWQGWALGMRYYDVHTGTEMDEAGQYEVDLDRLGLGVQRMLKHPPDKSRYGETLVE